MHGAGILVYKTNMELPASIHRQWHAAQAVTAPQFLICAYCVLERWEHADLAAPYWRWYWNDRAGAFVILGKKRVPLAPGRVMLIPPHTSFATGCTRPVGHLYLHFALGLDRPTPSGRVFSHRPSAAERKLIRRLMQAIQGEGADAGLGVSFLAQAVVNPALAAVPGSYWSGRSPDRRIEQAIRRIRTPTDATEGNVALAREAGMNVNAFTRKFRQATGQTPHQYRLWLRVERSCAWLREGGWSLDEIAAAAGFCDRFHFSRAFKQRMGVGPATFRARCRRGAGLAA